MKETIKNNLDIIIPAVLLAAGGYAAMYGICLFIKFTVGA